MIAEMELEVATESIGHLCILDESGDSRLQWDRNNPESVKAARERFEELRGKGYLAYKLDRGGAQGAVIDDFEPDAERIILHARMVGG